METAKKCPKCKNGVLADRVRRGPIARYLFFWLNLKRYKCYRCGKKSYILASDGHLIFPVRY